MSDPVGVPGEFIVVFERNADHLALINDHTSVLARAGASVVETYDISPEFRGYAFKANSTSVADVELANSVAFEIEARSDVHYVIQDTMVEATRPTPNDAATLKESCTDESDATWGIARVSHSEAYQEGESYTYSSSGEGVVAYIIDTGVRRDHDEFTGRFLENEVYDGYPTKNQYSAYDGSGHGTHVAGTVAGTKYGLAKSAKIAAVKVLGDDGSGSTAIVIKGVEFACSTATDATRTERVDIKKRVANMSLGGAANRAMNDAVRACIDKGMTFVVAAGNERAPACTSSPAAEPQAITVMASDINDKMSVFSNYGTCADIIAPGTNIKSAWIGGNTDKTNVISGTSMASPHVCGQAAVLLSRNPGMNPAEMKEELLNTAVLDHIEIPRDQEEGTVNKLLHDNSCSAEDP